MRFPYNIYLSILRGSSVSANPPFHQNGPVPTHQPNRRSSAQICEICGLAVAVSGVVAVDNRGRWGFTWWCLRTGRRRRRPYPDLSNPPRLDAPIGTRFVPLRGVIVIICANLRILRFRIPPCRVFAVNIRGRRWFTWRCLPTGRRRRRPYTDLSNPPRLDAPIGTRFVPLRGVVIIRANLRILRFRIPPCPAVAGQHSWSTVVHLAVFTQRATQASPLPR